jgi:hypothetical protein
MKKIFTIVLLFSAVIMSAQEVPASFPRKYLIEHFTGDGCGYCPSGMLGINDYIKNIDSSAVWVSHHYGFNTDEYSIEESGDIAQMFKPHKTMSEFGAPGMALNRTEQVPGMVFHPANLPMLTIEDPRTAEASVVITHTYAADTRELNVTVSGQVANTERESYYLTVLIKENGLVGKQDDYTYTWKTKPWLEFMHACVVRDFISGSLGDEVVVENQAYSKSFTYTLAEQWVPENCCIVAYITPVKRIPAPVINAEQKPVVAGTTGGAEYLPYGITESQAPNSATSITLDSMVVFKPTADKLEVRLFGDKAVRRANGQPAVRAMVVLDFNTSADALPVGTFAIQSDNAANTLTAGYRIDAQQTLAGTRFHYVESIKLIDEGEVVVCNTWRLQTGQMVVDAAGNIKLTGKFANGKDFVMTRTTATSLDNVTSIFGEIEKVLRNGQIVIRKNGMEYDMLGNILQ